MAQADNEALFSYTIISKDSLYSDKNPLGSFVLKKDWNTTMEVTLTILVFGRELVTSGRTMGIFC